MNLRSRFFVSPWGVILHTLLLFVVLPALAGDKHHQPGMYLVPLQPYPYAAPGYQAAPGYAPMPGYPQQYQIPSYAPQAQTIIVQPAAAPVGGNIVASAPGYPSGNGPISQTMRDELVEGLVDFYQSSKGTPSDETTTSGTRSVKLDRLASLRTEAKKRYKNLISKNNEEDTADTETEKKLSDPDEREVNYIVDRVLAAVRNQRTDNGYSPYAAPGYPYPNPGGTYVYPATSTYPNPYQPPAFLVPLQPVKQKHWFNKH